MDEVYDCGDRAVKLMEGRSHREKARYVDTRGLACAMRKDFDGIEALQTDKKQEAEKDKIKFVLSARHLLEERCRV